MKGKQERKAEMESGIYQSAAEDLLTAGCCDALRLGFSFFFMGGAYHCPTLMEWPPPPFLGGIKISAQL